MAYSVDSTDLVVWTDIDSTLETKLGTLSITTLHDIEIVPVGCKYIAVIVYE